MARAVAAPTPRHRGAGPFTAVDGGITVALRVTPKARRDAVVGVVPTAEGGFALKVDVTAVPEEGRANDAVVRLLAKFWGLAKSRIVVIGGATDRNKVIRIAGVPADLLALVESRVPPSGAKA